MKSKVLETSLELYPDLILDGEDGSVTVVITHDYYASDNDHGRELLLSFINAMLDDTGKMYRFIFVDSSVKLFSSVTDFTFKMSQIASRGASVLLCSESLDYYLADKEELDFAEFVTKETVALEILNSTHTITLG